MKRDVIEYVHEERDTINVLLELMLPVIDLINDRITINKTPVSFELIRKEFEEYFLNMDDVAMHVINWSQSVKNV